MRRFDMSKPFNVEDLPENQKKSRSTLFSPPTTESSVIANGLTVASQDMFGQMSTFALVANVGSAYEVQTPGSPDMSLGATHMIELMAFRATQRRKHQDILEEVEKLGGMIQCISNRDSILWCVDVFKNNIEPAMDILADTVLNPLLLPEEIDESKQIVELQLMQMAQKSPEILSRDCVQRAAYEKFPLGNHHFCPLDLVNEIDTKRIVDFREKYLYGQNCYLSGSGVDHGLLVKLAEKHFSGMQMKEGIGNDKKSRDVLNGLSKSTYTGGMIKNELELKDNFVRVAVAFEIGGWHDDDLVVACVLQQLLGGGSSFSAGGPGKGMYTRLYTDVLNRFHWVESAEAFTSIHEESGLLGIDASCDPENLPYMLQVIIDQLAQLQRTHVTQVELGRAKNMLKSMMFMQLESRLVLCEDIARQFVTYGRRDTPLEVCAKVDKVTAEDIQRLAKRMLASPPSVGSCGHDLSKLPDYDMIKSYSKQLSGLK